MKINDKSYKVSIPFTLLESRKNNGELEYKRGHYSHRDGTVLIYQQGYQSNHPKILRLSTIRYCREYHRDITGKLYTDIGIARKAGEFLKYVEKQARMDWYL